MPDRLLDIYNTLEEIQASGGGTVTNTGLDTSLANQTTTLSGDLDEVTAAVLAGNAADAITSVRGKTVYLEFTPTAMTNTWGGFTSLVSWDTALGLTAAVQRVQKGSNWFLLTFFGEFHLADGLFPASSGLVKFIDLDGVFTSLGSGVLGVSDDTKMIVIPKAREWVGNLFPSTRTITDSFYLDISNLLSVFSRPKEDLLHPLEGKNFVIKVGHSFSTGLAFYGRTTPVPGFLGNAVTKILTDPNQEMVTDQLTLVLGHLLELQYLGLINDSTSLVAGRLESLNDVTVPEVTAAVETVNTSIGVTNTTLGEVDTKLAAGVTAQEFTQVSTALLADTLIPETNLTLEEIKTAVVADALVQVASKTVLDNLKIDTGVIKGDTATLVSQGATAVSTLTTLNTVTVPAITTALGSIATEVTLASVLSKLSEIELNTDSTTSGANTSTLDAQLTAVNDKLAADALMQIQILSRVDNAPDAWNALNNLEILVVPAVTTAVNSVATLLTAQNTTVLPNLQTAVENVQSVTNDVVTAVNETYLELQGINTVSSGSKMVLDSVLIELEALNAKTNPDLALTSVTNSSVSSSAASVILALATPTRRSFTLFNNSTSILYLTFDVLASQATATVPIAPGGYYEMPKPLYLGDISGIWASTNGNASICQGV